MKQILFILTVLVLSISHAKAQSGLHVNEVFDGDIVKKTYMVENIIKGDNLSQYKLNYFRSIKFKATLEERKKIEKLVNEDIKNSLDLEQERQINQEQESRQAYETSPLSYAMMTLPPDGKFDPNSPNRWYLCYQCTPLRKNEYAITMVFMKGHATVKELRKAFKKK